MLVVDYFILLMAILIIGVSALQHSNDDAVDAFRGTSSELFKNKKIQGLDLFLNRGMAVLGVALVVLVIVSNSISRTFLFAL